MLCGVARSSHAVRRLARSRRAPTRERRRKPKHAAEGEPLSRRRRRRCSCSCRRGPHARARASTPQHARDLGGRPTPPRPITRSRAASARRAWECRRPFGVVVWLGSRSQRATATKTSVKTCAPPVARIVFAHSSSRKIETSFFRPDDTLDIKTHARAHRICSVSSPTPPLSRQRRIGNWRATATAGALRAFGPRRRVGCSLD